MQVPAFCKALADAPHGGQILLEEMTMAKVQPRLAELGARVAADPSMRALAAVGSTTLKQCRQAPLVVAALTFDVGIYMLEQRQAMTCMSAATHAPSWCNAGRLHAAAASQPLTDTPLQSSAGVA